MHFFSGNSNRSRNIVLTRGNVFVPQVNTCLFAIVPSSRQPLKVPYASNPLQTARTRGAGIEEDETSYDFGKKSVRRAPTSPIILSTTHSTSHPPFGDPLFPPWKKLFSSFHRKATRLSRTDTFPAVNESRSLV